MFKSLHKFDLTAHRLLPLQVLHLLFNVDFQGNFLVVLPVNANVDCSVGTLPNLLPYRVIVKRMVVRKDNHFFLALFVHVLSSWCSCVLGDILCSNFLFLSLLLIFIVVVFITAR